MIYLFDVDGTLTKPQRPISQEMVDMLLMLRKDNEVYLVTGSDYQTLLEKEQLTPAMEESLSGVFVCMGCEFWVNGKLVAQNDKAFPQQLRHELGKILENSDYPVRKGKHIVTRTGMLNFSIVGRNATPIDRKSYKTYDEEYGERKRIVEHLSHMFPEFDFHIGGEISIDICPKGQNKSQILKMLPEDNITFFGDKMGIGGNDFHLARAIDVENIGICCEVENPEETLSTLRYMF